MHLAVLNGPNLDQLGRREPEIYGTTTLGGLEAQISGWASQLGATVECHQSNHEGELIDLIHSIETDGIIINPCPGRRSGLRSSPRRGGSHLQHQGT